MDSLRTSRELHGSQRRSRSRAERTTRLIMCESPYTGPGATRAFSRSLGQEYAFSIPLNRVWNATVN